MHLIDPKAHTRRAFLRRSGQLAMAGSALPFALNLAAIGEAAAQAAPGDDYKALVCVFLFGGNDYANTVVTYDDPSYNAYSAIRGGGAGQTAGGVALAKADLAPTLLSPSTALADGRQYALHPSMTALAGLFNTDAKMAVQLNVGPLVVPLTRAQYNSGNKKLYPVPPKLFSHNDQQSTWQSSSPEGSTVGWGGNIGDLVLTQNSNSLFTCMSVSGNAVFLSGDTALQYQVSTGGAVKIGSVTGGNVYGSSSVKAAMAQLVQQARGHALENEYNKVTKRAVDAEGAITSAIGGAYAFGAYPATTFPDTGLGRQLAMVARLIRGRATLGTKRQVFFVSMGGFDLHDNLIANQPGLMKQLSDGMTAFYREMVVQGMGDKVTAFTASDFGRTLASNGDGSDHGWGGHHFVVGGAVKGKQIYGTPQVVSINNDSKLAGYDGHVGQGRLIPSTSVDQYGATLASWFGVPAGDLENILPNLRNFGGNVNGINYPKNIGFMV
ncbi:Tat pathway signal protein [Variovorax sp. WS11]|uniref:DUF1501 domain-containing protein n=1 Tax=Variovorax sp. WS11 TaxID=1105204 RepID=UPI000D0E1374|nr:DUF1501 domain-containing protein [Variovorax sp. WS11]NDZ13312.1 DUF1501 domain-containing protein [Variovorax sp. WS11]PSL79353.1 Tat pathway signal protein [Variovorax sp. WS11]